MYHTLNTNLENYIYYDIRVMKLKKNMNYRIRYILRNNIFLIFVFILGCFDFVYNSNFDGFMLQISSL